MRARAVRCCCPLLLSAGELRWPQPFRALQTQQRYQFPSALPPLLLFQAAQTNQDILLHGHVGEQGVLLKQIPDPPLLGRQIDAPIAVKEHSAV